MKKTKAYAGCLGNFLLGALGVVGVGWFLTLKFPKSVTAVYLVGGLLILMCLWSAYDEMRKKEKYKNERRSGVQDQPVEPEKPGDGSPDDPTRPAV